MGRTNAPFHSWVRCRLLYTDERKTLCLPSNVLATFVSAQGCARSSGVWQARRSRLDAASTIVGHMKFGFCISGRGTLARMAVRHAPALGFTAGSVLLDFGVSDETEQELRSNGLDVTRLRGKDRTSVQSEIEAYFDSAHDDMWVLTFDKMLPSTVVNPRIGRIINVHMALLPAFRGRDGLRQAIRGGARFAGATIHEIDSSMDQGNIVSQFVTEILPEDSAESLGSRVFSGVAPMYAQTLMWYAQGRVSRDDTGRPHVREATFRGPPCSPAIESAVEALTLFGEDPG
jgi:phosphoribosylglycinamide formyltransferase-1